MSKAKVCFIAEHSFREFTDIDTQFLEKHGIKFLMLDLDNTIAAYDEHEPSVSVIEWFEVLRGSGIRPFIVSNSTRTDRVGAFAKALDCGFIMKAGKPLPRSLNRAMAESGGFSPDESALVGDQTFTDVLSANLAGVVPILVRPKKFTNVFLNIRYYIEMPIRLMCKNKH